MYFLLNMVIFHCYVSLLEGRFHWCEIFTPCFSWSYLGPAVSYDWFSGENHLSCGLGSNLGKTHHSWAPWPTPRQGVTLTTHGGLGVTSSRLRRVTCLGATGSQCQKFQGHEDQPFEDPWEYLVVATQIFSMFTPKFGEDEPILTHMFQMSWNHQRVTWEISWPWLVI